MSDDTLPHIRRPVPRRPFEIGVLNHSPDPNEYSPPPSPSPRPYDKDDDEHATQTCLDPRVFNPPVDSSSRAASYRVLTSSTLSGIYSPDVAGYPSGEEDAYTSVTPSFAPAGFAGGPAPEVMDETIYKLVRERSAMLGSRRRSSALSGRSGQSGWQHSSAALPLSLRALRTGLLFLLGMGYGALLSRLSIEQKWASFPVEGIIKPGYDGRYLAAWGLCGVVLGSLLPWCDGKWEEVFEKNNGGRDSDYEEEAVKEDEVPGTDWALVVRGIGAFAGIVFAIRKVPWTSTMQVSLTLAMVNPFLWYLIDRSKPGFLLSAAVGLAGSIVMMGLNHEIMPTPTGYSSAYLYQNQTGGPRDGGPLMLGGLATQQTIETGLWVLSVLFCSCVCFGNIGRRLALNRSAAGRGRWGGLR